MGRMVKARGSHLGGRYKESGEDVQRMFNGGNPLLSLTCLRPAVQPEQTLSQECPVVHHTGIGRQMGRKRKRERTQVSAHRRGVRGVEEVMWVFFTGSVHLSCSEHRICVTPAPPHADAENTLWGTRSNEEEKEKDRQLGTTELAACPDWRGAQGARRGYGPLEHLSFRAAVAVINTDKQLFLHVTAHVDDFRVETQSSIEETTVFHY
ncbi:unnamed protein product [Menidia menidia]|uniref:(Atlantic silverside) hypothetical protein n=1 Tax=Menidia menidia TaxID=238744 RepID=A0A8S4A6G2_9TELE|nr:unnamed protein product [Menidia menidia]